jgi:hypothetical protein
VTLWRIPSYRRLWSATAISETGDWLLFIALPVYVFQVSGSALSTSLTWNSPAITDRTWWYAALFIAVGVPATATATGLITGTQRAAPPRVRGRVLSLIQVTEALGQGTGIVLAGLLSSSIPLTLMLDAQASVYLASAIVAAASFGVTPRRARLVEFPPFLVSHRSAAALGSADVYRGADDRRRSADRDRRGHGCAPDRAR